MGGVDPLLPGDPVVDDALMELSLVLSGVALAAVSALADLVRRRHGLRVLARVIDETDGADRIALVKALAPHLLPSAPLTGLTTEVLRR
jgi:hypothetical protein